MTNITLNDKKALAWIKTHNGSISFHSGYIHFTVDGSIDWRKDAKEKVDYVEFKVGLDSEYGRTLSEATERRMSTTYTCPVNLETFEEDGSNIVPVKRELSGGKTPWDQLFHEELLNNVQRMFASLNSVRGVMQSYKSTTIPLQGFDEHPFWGLDGGGGIAMEKVSQIIDEIYAMYNGDNLYRSFYRYANDLLFEPSDYKISSGWHVCSTCRKMVEDDRMILEGQPCNNFTFSNNCDGTLRKLQWNDFGNRNRGGQ
ncbi:hypothetical protein [Paenibacillus periandrae]|uniref:hypothetical protein n=1 Tax=Paenibacillus periandrae TaxID=1761741 RepID=UPI001F09EA69|nr:hypothetical protein [Paenibacillus periandrae]